jgi:hypothetical protein
MFLYHYTSHLLPAEGSHVSTARTMHPFVGLNGYLHLTNEYPLTVRVEILDVKTVYGNERYLVRPVTGAGETWVSADRVTDEFTPEPVELEAPDGETPQCNALFCVLPRHADEQHTDATGHSWLGPVPAREVLAHVYGTGE